MDSDRLVFRSPKQNRTNWAASNNNIALTTQHGFDGLSRACAWTLLRPDVVRGSLAMKDSTRSARTCQAALGISRTFRLRKWLPALAAGLACGLVLAQPAGAEE